MRAASLDSLTLTSQFQISRNFVIRPFFVKIVPIKSMDSEYLPPRPVRALHSNAHDVHVFS